MVQHTFIGVDVAKAKFDVAMMSKNKWKNRRFDNTPTGFKAFMAWLKPLSNPWVCMEATGCYSEGLAEFLYKHRIRVCVVNPCKIKYFAMALLKRNKTDTLDAKTIAQYAQMAELEPFKPRSRDRKALRELMQLVEMLKRQLVQLKNQRNSAQIAQIRRELDKLIKQLEKRIARLEVKAQKLVNKDENLAKSVALLTTCTGIGPLTALKLVANLPNIENFQNAKQLAAFCGVSPRQKSSGNYLGQTVLSKCGHSGLRKSLYMPALVLLKHQGAFKPFIQRLKNKGLRPKAIIGALMRKLVHIIFGILKHQRPFEPALV